MNKINLKDLELKTFTEQDALDYCQINNINPNRTAYLDLGNNKLTDISDLKIFKNLQYLYLYNNKIKDISMIKYLNNLKWLSLDSNEISDISVLKSLNNLENLYIGNTEIKDISVIKNLKKLELLDIDNLRLESDQIQYINSCKNLEILICINGFKDMSIIKKLNKNIDIIK